MVYGEELSWGRDILGGGTYCSFSLAMLDVYGWDDLCVLQRLTDWLGMGKWIGGGEKGVRYLQRALFYAVLLGMMIIQ